MKFGYARGKKEDSDFILQLEALNKSGCDKIYKETKTVSNGQTKLESLLEIIREGDILIVESLDRLGLTRNQLLDLLHHFNEIGVGFRSLKESLFDTSTESGRNILYMASCLKEMELKVHTERTKKGIISRSRGRNGGRPKGTYNKSKARAAALRYSQQIPIEKILEDLDISKSTLYRYLKNEGVRK